jgi:hypothetical protein
MDTVTKQENHHLGRLVGFTTFFNLESEPLPLLQDITFHTEHLVV